MEQHDPFAAVIQQLSDNQLRRLSRSLEYRASRDARNGQVGRSSWYRAIRLLVVGELARRDGQIRQIPNMTGRLRAAASHISDREIVGLMSEYQSEIEDFERHCGRVTILVPKVMLSVLHRALAMRGKRHRPEGPVRREPVWLELVDEVANP